MAAINFVNNYLNLDIPESHRDSDTLLLYSDKLKSSDIKGTYDVRRVGFHTYKTKYLEYHQDKIIILDYSNIIGPQNRTLACLEYLQDHSQSKKKIVFDTVPFRGEPWRFWYSFIVTDQNPWGWPHSYTAESVWKKWFEYNVEYEDSPYSKENMMEKVLDLDIYSEVEKVDSQFTFVEATDMQLEKYLMVKEEAFKKFYTPKKIISYMSKNIPLTINFDSYLENKSFDVLDIPVNRFIVEENNRRQDIYNVLTKNG